MSGTLDDGRKQGQTGYSAVLIAGPTASGKSALALALAEVLDGVILNADSMQLYRELAIVTARPLAEDLARVPHRLYGVLPASEAFSTGDWLRLVQKELEELRALGRLPVFVGGTGLYFKALTEGFAELPGIDPDIRTACRVLADEGGIDAVRRELRDKDPRAAGALQDLQRLTRALEVVLSTGRTLADWQREAHGESLLSADRCLRLVLAPPRAWLHERIAQRAALMLEGGGIDEVRSFLKHDLPKTLPAMRAIGVKEIEALLARETDREEAERRLTVATRQYAKRQETWFRNQMADWERLDPSCERAEEMARRICGRLRR